MDLDSHILGIAVLRLELGWCCNPKIPEDPLCFEGLMPEARDLAAAAPDSLGEREGLAADVRQEAWRRRKRKNG